MKRLILTALISAISIAALVAEEKKDGQGNGKDPVDLSVSLEYYSNYLWRGTRFFNGDGAFVPKVAWSVFNSGLILSVSGEIAASWVFNGFSQKPGRYDYSVDSSGNFVRKKLRFNSLAYATHSMDFGADYSYNIKDVVTIGAGVWYWWYFNSRHAREYARPIVEYTVPKAVGLSQVSFVDISFLSTTLTIGLPVVPWVNPTVSLTHDYYTGLKRGGDYYVQLGINHLFDVTKEVIITPAISAGYYYSTTSRLTRYSTLWDVSASGFDTTPSLSFSGQTRVITLGGVKQTRTPLKKGFSDITTSLVLAFTKGHFTLSGGFYWCFVPSKTWYNAAEIHRLYARVGATCAI